MLPRFSSLTLLSGALLVLGCQSGGTASAPTPAASAPAAAPAATTKADEPNTTDGVYTVAQAQRGLGVFNDVCSECHDAEDWTDEVFKSRWEELSVYRLWYYIYERMPHGNPGSRTRAQVTDALTYIFEINGLPPGDMELGTDDDSIDQYWVIWDTGS